jgi:hypothetical protein
LEREKQQAVEAAAEYQAAVDQYADSLTIERQARYASCMLLNISNSISISSISIIMIILFFTSIILFIYVWLCCAYVRIAYLCY